MLAWLKSVLRIVWENNLPKIRSALSHMQLTNSVYQSKIFSGKVANFIIRDIIRLNYFNVDHAFDIYILR